MVYNAIGSYSIRCRYKVRIQYKVAVDFSRKTKAKTPEVAKCNTVGTVAVTSWGTSLQQYCFKGVQPVKEVGLPLVV